MQVEGSPVPDRVESASRLIVSLIESIKTERSSIRNIVIIRSGSSSLLFKENINFIRPDHYKYRVKNITIRSIQINNPVKNINHPQNKQGSDFMAKSAHFTLGLYLWTKEHFH
jgi:hypothetical protein